VPVFSPSQSAALDALEVVRYRPLTVAPSGSELQRAVAQAARLDLAALLAAVSLPAELHRAEVKKRLWPTIRTLRRRT
jgi:hypothetical protein